MYALTADVLAVLSRSHKVTGRLLASVNGSAFTYPVSFSEASVSVSGASAVRRTLSATVVADLGGPEIDTFRTELRAEYGITRIDGVTVWVPVFTGPVVSAEQSGLGVWQVRADDRWRWVANARLLAPLSTSGSTVDAITTLMESADARITCTDLTGSVATHPTSVWERDRDQAVMDLAKSIGAVVAFDVDGTAKIRPAPALSDAVVWRVYGGDGGVLVESLSGVSQGNTYNAVVALGEGSDGEVPVYAVASVTDASSPIRYGGPFGSRPRFYASPLITSTAQAESAAAALLARVTGVARSVRVESAPHPGLDAGDVIDVEVEPGVFERHIVDTFTLPLGPGGMSVETRTSVEAAGE